MNSDLEEFHRWWRWRLSHDAKTRAGYKIGHFASRLPSPDTRADFLTVQPFLMKRIFKNMRKSFIPNYRELLDARWMFNQMAYERGYRSVSYSLEDTERFLDIIRRTNDAITEEETESGQVGS